MHPSKFHVYLRPLDGRIVTASNKRRTFITELADGVSDMVAPMTSRPKVVLVRMLDDVIKQRNSPPTNGSAPHVIIANVPAAQFAAVLYDDKSNSVVPSGEYVGLLAVERRSRSIPYATRHRAHYGKMTSSTKPEVHHIFHCSQRRTELRPRSNTYRKFREVWTSDF